ncbi:MAG: type II toxin-antitoxin system VapC family toxin [Anaerolineae bacterium]
MSTYLVDASVVVERIIRGQFTPNAQVLFSQLASGDVLVVPEFCLLECTNVIWKQVRFQGMSQQQAERTLRDLRALPLKRVPTKSVLNSALQIGLRHQLAIYDAVYVALAKRSNYPLITVDQPQTRAATAEGLTLKPITDFTP